MSGDKESWAALDSANERLVEACHPLLRADLPGGHKGRRRWRSRDAQQARQPRRAANRGTRSPA